ncbi:alpha/beta fold hydrolase [Desulfoluna butyratoxydans]|uniref:Alpha/beta hydrolase fold n=1 Tax=Desulfoluna butyratoxydans TaxID=231438 RepID=A0A4U8YRY9_9BACT|nr:alpha/beta hydrolase [Desulfoluna butyratoxydans]VFQ47106.1 alpha/beta hydrolase fold [Desulfoluna butyratoxydans]
MTCTVEHLCIVTDAGSFHAKKWTPQNPSSSVPMVLLHDSLGCVDLWHHFPLTLAERLSLCVIAYDRLGFGRSSPRKELPSIRFIEEEATDYFPWVKRHFSLEDYILFGHSVGGAMAVNIAARDKGCVAVITEASQAFVEDRTVAGIKAAQKAFQEPGQMDRLKKWHGDKGEWVFRAWTDIWLSSAFSGWSLDACMGEVTCPVLAIHGENDEYGSTAFPEFIAHKAKGISEMAILNNCGHIPHKEKPEEVVNKVELFLNKNAVT